MALQHRFSSTLFSGQRHNLLPLQNPLKTKQFSSLSFSISQTPYKVLHLRAISSSTPTLESQKQEQEKSVLSKTRLIAQNVPWTSTTEEIRTLFEKYGTVLDVELSMYNKTKNRGLAFITMGSEEEALAALSNLDSYELEGRVIKVEFARALKKKPSSGLKGPVTKYNVFVGNLTWRVRSSNLKEFFGDANGVVSAEVVFQTNPRRPTGYGFVSFSSKEEAEAAIAAFNGKEFMGRPIRLGFSKKQAGDSQEEPKDGDPLKGAPTKGNGDGGLSSQGENKYEEVPKDTE
ncbi:RNA-binding (RRM/RBD/RNP motifs) family protein [Tasmannia lanceolata]|uniref:RNA-binding (RRM/RBD/RNP motifs) family protein n=1 Tax=Tasmannia lanceolata TaxID=3420 RepID=UPI004062E913